MSIPSLPVNPDYPQPGDIGSVFDEKAYATVLYISQTFPTALNAIIAQFEQLVDDALGAGLEEAAGYAEAAQTQANAASASASAAANVELNYPVQNDATTNYNVDANDGNVYLRMTNAAAKTVTARPNATHALPANFQIHIRNVGGGDLTLVEGSGVTISPPFGGSLIVPKGATVTLKRVAADEFDLLGQTEEGSP